MQPVVQFDPDLTFGMWQVGYRQRWPTNDIVPKLDRSQTVSAVEHVHRIVKTGLKRHDYLSNHLKRFRLLSSRH